MSKFNWLVVVAVTLISGWIGNCVSTIVFGWTTSNLSSASMTLTGVCALVGFLASLAIFLDKIDFE